jgi:DNA-binding NtrC family response regulator
VRLQAKLLRVLQEGIIEPVGSNRRVPVDLRIVSSTNRDLEAAMEDGSFREDLFYRLNVFRFELPALRERSEDVPVLARCFLEEFGRELGKGPLQISDTAVALLRGHRWRGNVRELRNLMERIAVLTPGADIEDALVRSVLPEAAVDAGDASYDLAAATAETERRTILQALAATGDNKVEAATLLGIGERTLWTKLKKYGI